MRIIHFDSNFIAGALTSASPERAMLERCVSTGRSLGVSSMAWAEFLCGPFPSDALPDVVELLGDGVPMTAEDATRAAHLYNATGRRKRSLADCVIAAIALRCDAEIATNDLDHYKRFAEFGLDIAE